MALVAIDQLTKTWRVQVLARGLGYRTAFARAFAFNVTSDASASLTPLRAGGEPVRFAGILYCGLSVPDTLALMGVEGAMEYVMVLAIAVYVGSAYGGPLVGRHASAPRAGHPSGAALDRGDCVRLCLAAVGAPAPRRPCAPARYAATFAPRSATPPDPAVDGRRLATAHVSARGSAPRRAARPRARATVAARFGTRVFGSFALLYGQMFLPTPAGAGAVDVAS